MTSDEVSGAPIFKYQPLGPKDFRILLLGPGKSSDDLRATLRHVSLDDYSRPTYETVSYAWGDAKSRSSMIIGGAAINIPASSANVLRRIRSSDSVRSIWIDAICIDQSNITEHGQQVALMRDIYSRGSLNIIYLGESDEHTAAGLWMMECIISEMASQTGGLSKIRRSVIDEHGVHQHAHDLRLEPPYPGPALHSIYRRPWFSRLWVVQEAFVSPVSTCLIGHATIPLHDLLVAAVYFRENYNVEQRELGPAFHNATEMYHRIYQHANDELRITQLRPGLIECLNMSGSFDVSVPSDSVFALLGLLSDRTRRDNPKAWNLLQPDYTKPVEAVFADASRAAIVMFDGMGLLPFISHQHESYLHGQHVPSWVLDPRRKREELRSSEFPWWRYNASAGLPTRDVSCLSSNVLVVGGLYLDDVEEVGPFLDASTYVAWPTLCAFVKASADVTQYSVQPGSNQSAFERLARTLVAGLTALRERTVPREGVENQQPRGAELLLKALQSLSNDKTGPAELAYRQALINACHMRRVFRTRHGFIGLGPRLMQTGDQAVILYESEWPSILRPADERCYHHFVGSCYIDRIMDGEASGQFGAISDRHRSFRLR